MGVGINHWEWEVMGLKKTFPLTSTSYYSAYSALEVVYVYALYKFTSTLTLALTLVVRSEAESHQTCRGTIPLGDAGVQEHGVRSFVVSCNRRAYYLRALSAVDRDRWVRSIRVAISQSKIAKPCSE